MSQVIIDFSLDSETFNDLCDVAGYAIGYWAREAEVSKDIYTIHDQEGDTHVVTKEKLEKTILDAYAGNYKLIDHNQRAVHELVTENEAGEIDTECIDLLIQYALFGEVVYG